jgi:hypothetical protein
MTPFLLLCECLSLKDGRDAVDGLRQTLSSLGAEGWQAMLGVADAEMLAPALWLALARKGLTADMPAALRDGLRRRYTMNAMLNERIRAEALRVLGLCRDLGVEPAILKGGATLFEADAAMLGGRAMRDLDFLVPHEAVEPIAAAMRADGFVLKEEENDDWVYTYPGLQRPQGVVAVELHWRLGQQRALLPADTVWRASRPVDGFAGLRVLSPTHRIWHNLFHSQIQDQGHAMGFVWLRQLLDLAEIRRRHEGDIDWRGLEAMMARSGMDGILRSRLFQLQALLGLPAPLPTSAADEALHQRSLRLLGDPRAMARARFRAALMAPFKPYHIDLIYGCGIGNPVRLALARARHALVIAHRHRGNLARRIWGRRAYDI